GMVTVDHREAEQMRHPTRAWIAARVGDEADAAQHATVIEQYAQDHRVPGDPRAGVLRRIERIVDRLADILVGVVEPEVDLAQPARLRPACAEASPALELLARRAAVAAAGKVAVALGAHGRSLEAQPQAADF